MQNFKSITKKLFPIDSIAVDVSPFCCLMGRVKTFALNLYSKKFNQITKEHEKIFERLNKQRVPDYFVKDSNDEGRTYYEVALLAYLDAMGFARRSSKSLNVLFPVVLNRYVALLNSKRTGQIW